LQHLISKHSKMTNSELLQSDLLDIVFENRNKQYGAYSLRKGYNSRLLKSLGAGLSLIALFIVIIAGGNHEKKPVPGLNTK